MTRALIAALSLAAVASASATDTFPGPDRTIEIKVTRDGFRPREVKLKKGVPTTLVFRRITEDTCITAVDIPDEQVRELELPLDRPMSVTITPHKGGVEKFHCSAMAMGHGKLVVTE